MQPFWILMPVVPPYSVGSEQLTGVEILSDSVCYYIYIFFHFLDQHPLPKFRSFGENCNLHIG